MTQSSFTQKLIEIDVLLDKNPITNQPISFSGGGGGSNQVTLSNTRTSVRIQHSGLPKGSTAQVQVWGLTPSLMNELSTLGLVFQVIPKNTIAIRAGDASGLSTIFVGTIFSAVPDFNRGQDVPVSFDCIAGVIDNVVPATASSYPQGANVATIMANLATRMGYGFENNNVDVTLPPTYLYGTAWDQVKQAADAANIVVDRLPGELGQLVLAIWPKGGSRTSIKTVPLISPATGMMGYPSYSQIGLVVKTLFNPQITVGALVQIQSSLPKATGTWVVLDLNHDLDSQLPEGQWTSTVTCYNPNYAKFGIPAVV